MFYIRRVGETSGGWCLGCFRQIVPVFSLFGVCNDLSGRVLGVLWVFFCVFFSLFGICNDFRGLVPAVFFLGIESRGKRNSANNLVSGMIGIEFR